ncbi:hypothetical protein CHS0354_030571 [Potamilus streckersoni]|uniref:sphingomyelin phosphodiesterase n=1 Tax=Potamilus streckersoni TaxID=2493646 RepID=A0AAE0VNM6_9BIVA|nr:hypothetical protein CHS0354_030571 [Potamilus streckersoni]
MYENGFPSAVLHYMFELTEIILGPFFYSFNNVLSPFILTTSERNKPWLILPCLLVQCPINFAAFLVLLAPAFVSFCLRIILYRFKKPYILSYSHNIYPKQHNTHRNGNTKYNTRTELGFQSGLRDPEKLFGTFSIATLNVCLLPEALSRFNNLDKTSKRAKEIGERLVIDQMHYGSLSPRDSAAKDNHGLHRKNAEKFEPLEAGVKVHFPELDFLCIQECFHRGYSRKLLKELHKVYPWIIYDVGVFSWRSNHYGFNSGLMFASRHPILNVDFKYFPVSCGTCAIACKGLLMTKVLLNEKIPGSKREVGYIYVTHLQAFDGDKKCCQHNLFTVYADVCRETLGKDRDWAVGTEMRPFYVKNEEVMTPEGLQRVLNDPCLRENYVINADIQFCSLSIMYSHPKRDERGNIVQTPAGGKRRIDLILCRNDCPLRIDCYNFVSRLAGLTDHIPVVMTFTCDR